MGLFPLLRTRKTINHGAEWETSTQRPQPRGSPAPPARELWRLHRSVGQAPRSGSGRQAEIYPLGGAGGRGRKISHGKAAGASLKVLQGWLIKTRGEEGRNARSGAAHESPACFRTTRKRQRGREGARSGQLPVPASRRHPEGASWHHGRLGEKAGPQHMHQRCLWDGKPDRRHPPPCHSRPGCTPCHVLPSSPLEKGSSSPQGIASRSPSRGTSASTGPGLAGCSGLDAGPFRRLAGGWRRACGLPGAFGFPGSVIKPLTGSPRGSVIKVTSGHAASIWPE